MHALSNRPTGEVFARIAGMCALAIAILFSPHDRRGKIGRTRTD